MLFEGRNRVRYGYSRYGWTRNNGKTWHGGIDVEGLDNITIRMPGYNGKSISGKVITARIVTNHSNLTWEWGYYVCVQLDAAQTPDAINYLYFCHCAKLLVKVGQQVKTGDALAIMGNTGNAALASPPFAHCHFEVRAKATGRGLDPTAYAGLTNAAGTYGTEPVSTVDKPKDTRMQRCTVHPGSRASAMAVAGLAYDLGIDQGYTASAGDATAIWQQTLSGGGKYSSVYVEGK